MPLLTLALWLLCGFATAVFAAVSLRGRWRSVCAAIGFLLGALSTSPTVPVDVEMVGVLAGLVAGLGLVWTRHWILTSLAAGVLAGIWTAVLEAQGLPAWLAWPAAALVPAVAGFLAATRPTFAPQALRDEAMLFVFLLACVVAIAPGVHDGWRAAMNLGMDPSATTTMAVPVWTLVLSLSALVLGGAYSLWSRR